ncbi:hypothetical protein [Microbulbifer celer]|uniref:Uncharacterized protein n=1 Tax=Microbulbifer celer TaxID=435905 RepID=A0ABW3UC73_9GAMM|nr:hypothetical protein [Microbulbifer celer]UFN57349.1 hypothetical protein LPW13_17550 [Microbulbifer celer]
MKTQLPAQQPSTTGNPLLFGSAPVVEDGEKQEQPQQRESVDVLPPEELERCFVFGYN